MHVDQRAPRRDARDPRRDDARECEVARGTHRGRRETSRRASLATMSAASALAFAPTPAALAPRARVASSRPPLSRHDGPRRANWHRRLRSPRAAAISADDDPTPRADSDSVHPDTARAGVSRRDAVLRAGASVAVAASASRVILPGSARASPASARAALGAGASPTSPPSGPTTLAPSSYRPWTGEEVLTPVGGGALELSPMGLGTWSWGNQFVWGYDESMDPELRDVFNRAVAAGINTFDTADSYGTGNGFDGRSEVLLGEFLRGCPDRAAASRVNIATKFAAYPWRITPNSVVQAARESAARLGKDAIELGQLHWSTGNYQPLQERALWAGIADAYDAGVIRAVGLSNFGPKQLRRIHKYMSDRGVPIATLQVQYSLLSRFPESNGTRETCDELGVRLIAYSPLALGLLTGKYSTDAPPPGLRGFAYKDVLPALPELLGTMREIGDGRGGKTPAQVAVNWCLCKDTTPIPGVKNARQLEENLGALGWRLTREEVDALDAAAAKCGKSVSQNIFQTA